jgi:hypothetical protein
MEAPVDWLTAAMPPVILASLTMLKGAVKSLMQTAVPVIVTLKTEFSGTLVVLKAAVYLKEKKSVTERARVG